MAIPTYRRGEIDDLPALTEIYNYYVVNTSTTFDLEPHSVQQRQDWFDHYHESGPYRLMVMLDGRKKTEAEKIQLRISQRLSKLKKEKTLTEDDHDFLWKWTHQLYELALKSSK